MLPHAPLAARCRRCRHSRQLPVRPRLRATRGRTAADDQAGRRNQGVRPRVRDPRRQRGFRAERRHRRRRARDADRRHGAGRRERRDRAGRSPQARDNTEFYLTATHFHPEHDLGATAFPADAKMVRWRAQQAEAEEIGAQTIERFSSFSPAIAELLDGARFVPSTRCSTTRSGSISAACTCA